MGGERNWSDKVDSVFERLIAAGVITPPAEDGDPLENCPAIRLSAGAGTGLIDDERGERQLGSAGSLPRVSR